MASKPVQCANIGGTLVAVLAFIAFINGVLVWCGSLVGVEDLTFEYVLGLLFIPAAWLMGVETAVSDIFIFVPPFAATSTYTYYVVLGWVLI